MSDYAREAAHKRWDKAQGIAEENPGTSAEDVYGELNWNADWHPGDPTSQEVHDNWDYYYNATNGGQIPINQVRRQLQVSKVGSPGLGDLQKSVEEARSNINFENPVIQRSGDSLNVQGYNAEQQGGEEEEKRDALAPGFDASVYDPSQGFGALDSLGGYRIPTTMTNRIYADLFSSEGYDPEANQDNWFDHIGDYVMPIGSTINPEMLQAQSMYPEIFGSRDVSEDARRSGEGLDTMITRYREQGLDDGTLNAGNLTSNFMTGSQYLKYIEAGIPSTIDVEELRNNPDKVYNKRNEMVEHEFAPYIPDNGAYGKMIAENLLAAPSDAASALGQARNDNTSYGITIDGHSVNSKDLDMGRARDWYLGEVDKINQNGVATDILGPDGTVLFTQTSNIKGQPLYEIINDAGDTLWMQDPDNPESLNNVPKSKLDNGVMTIRVEFEDGSHINLDGYGYNDDPYSEYMYLFGEGSQDHRKVNESSLPRYEMGNGDSLSIEDVRRILEDDQAMSGSDEQKKGSKDEGIEYDFGPGNLSKPSAYLGELTEGDWGDFAPVMLDTLAQSAPYFVKQISIPVGISDAFMASKNLDPTQTKNDRTYGQAVGTIDDATLKAMEDLGIDVEDYKDYYNGNGLWGERVLANALMPFTEMGYGSIGTKLKNPLSKALRKSMPFNPAIPYIDAVMGAGGEALEEIPGNWVEEARRNGFTKSWYGDYLRDKDTNEILRDSLGNPLVTQDSTGERRAEKFWGEAPESALLGGILGGGAEVLHLPRTISESRHIKNLRDDELSDPEYHDVMEQERRNRS